jgi:hypothetical protein
MNYESFIFLYYCEHFNINLFHQEFFKKYFFYVVFIYKSKRNKRKM